MPQKSKENRKTQKNKEIERSQDWRVRVVLKAENSLKRFFVVPRVERHSPRRYLNAGTEQRLQQRGARRTDPERQVQRCHHPSSMTNDKGMYRGELPYSSSPCFFLLRKKAGKPPKRQGFLFPDEPLKSLGNKEITLKKQGLPCK